MNFCRVRLLNILCSLSGSTHCRQVMAEEVEQLLSDISFLQVPARSDLSHRI